MKVQIIHIDGPYKGEIQEFTEDKITIGRHPSCAIVFPPDLRVVSRQHACIIREGNRFKLVDHSTNGTLVNGKFVKETYLRSGDVITFAEGGPKVSFLLLPADEIPLHSIEDHPVQPDLQLKEEPRPNFEALHRSSPTRVKAPLVIQFGTKIKDFNELPVRLGRSPECEMLIDHPAVAGIHAEISFSGGEYFIKALEGTIYLNDTPVKESILKIDDILALSPQGPRFRFLGHGRLAEILEEEEDVPSQEDTPPPQESFLEKLEKKAENKLPFWKKLFKK